MSYIQYMIRLMLFGMCLVGVYTVAGQTLDTLFNVGSVKLHVKIWKGKNHPILFESGAALDASQWDSIARTVHGQLGATVITYDRAGFGLSTLDTANYNIEKEVINLETVLQKLQLDREDLMLVGHSLGAFYNMLFAFRHPGMVKAILLLDPRIPSEEDSRFAMEYFKELVRKDFEPAYMNLYYLLERIAQNGDYVRQRPLPATIPVLDIMAESGPNEKEVDNERFKNDQRKFVQISSSRTLVMAKNTTHNIPQDNPELVIRQIANYYTTHVSK